jgi:hypothetical protein
METPYILQRLRDLGKQIHDCVRGKFVKHANTNQFVIAAICSTSEVTNSDDDFIVKAEKWFASLSTRNFTFNERFLKYKRMVYLLNYNGIHGESRLLDCTGKRRRNIGTNSTTTWRRDFLAEIKEEFYQQFDRDENYQLVLYTHYIPCTLPKHKCSKILADYAAGHNKLVIGYDLVWRETCEQKARSNLKDTQLKCLHQYKRMGNKSKQSTHQN